MVQVILRTLKPSDKPRMAQLANNQKIWDNVRDGFGHPYTEKNAEEFIQRQAKSDTEMVFAIDYNGELCGLTGLIFSKKMSIENRPRSGIGSANPFGARESPPKPLGFWRVTPLTNWR